jgi:hypothetical protein
MTNRPSSLRFTDDKARNWYTRPQFFEPSSDGGECSLVANQEIPVEIVRDHGGAAWAPDLQGVTDLGAGCPRRRRTCFVKGKVEDECVARCVEAARGVFAHFRRVATSREDQFDVIVE